MKNLYKIALVIINMIILLYSISLTIDKLPLHLTDFVVTIFAVAGVVYLTDLIIDCIYKLIDKNKL